MASSSTERNFARIKTIQSWQSDFPRLIGENSSEMRCAQCCKWKDKLTGVKNYSDAFIKGSFNYHWSSIADHSKSAQHMKSCDLKEKEICEKEGRKYKKKFVNVILSDSPIVWGLKKMSEAETNRMRVLFEVSYLNAKKGLPYSNFSDWLEWAELQGVKLPVPYKNRTHCTEFIKYIDQVLFDKNVRNKLERINFIAIFYRHILWWEHRLSHKGKGMYLCFASLTLLNQ